MTNTTLKRQQKFDRLKRLKVCFNEKGFKKALLKVMRSLQTRIFNIKKGTVYQFDLCNYSGRDFNRDSRYDFKWGTQEDILGIDGKETDFNGNAKNYVLERLKKGDKILFVTFRSDVMGYVLFMVGELELTTSRRIALPSTSVCLYKLFFLEKFRGKRALQHMKYYVLDYLQKKGFHSFYLITFNSKFGNFLERIGCKPVGNFLQVTFLKKSVPFLSKSALRAVKHV